MGGRSAPASLARHAAGAVTEAVLLAVIVAALLLGLGLVFEPAGRLAGTQPAAAGGKGSITVPDGSFGGTTTATVNPGGDAWVRGRCYQGGNLVYVEYVQVDGNNQAVLQLGPTANWTSGAASCTAEELTLGRNQRWRVLASTTFQVSA